MAPMLVPAMQSTGILSSSSTLSTPIWAIPRAPPPDSTKQTRGRTGAEFPAAAAAGFSALAAAKANAPPASSIASSRNLAWNIRIVA